uniref:Uncharacterized protein n=1 Tax=Anguilla anguilla TaxID=7936 RepID=A0A0E9VC99_ANGAN
MTNSNHTAVCRLAEMHHMTNSN